VAFPVAAFHEAMKGYQKQLAKGTIQEAYRGLMEYFQVLRRHFRQQYPDYTVSSSVYQGYMDMTYFACSPRLFTRRRLKVAIVFLHEAFRFEVWLVGANRSVQAQYWKLFIDSKWAKYHLATPSKGVDAILDHIVVETPDFRDLEALTQQIEQETMQFVNDVEEFLSKHTTNSMPH
jgi:hypothetical protein